MHEEFGLQGGDEALCHGGVQAALPPAATGLGVGGTGQDR